MTINFPQIAQRLFNVPLAIRPEKAEMIVAALYDRMGIAQLDRINATSLSVIEMEALAAGGRSEVAQRDQRKVYEQVDGVAIIPAYDTLIHRGALDPESGMTSYTGILSKLRAAMSDESVRGIWMEYDTPGGEAAGCFALADELASYTKAEGGKPIWAYVNEQACSAGYALAGVCDKVFMPASAMVGSVGVYCVHLDMSAAMEKAGLKATIIKSGENKAFGNEYEPLAAAALTKLQKWVDDSRLQFAQVVAAGRRLSVKKVMDTEADWFTGEDAVNIGFVDGLMSEVEAWDKFQRSLARAA